MNEVLNKIQKLEQDVLMLTKDLQSIQNYAKDLFHHISNLKDDLKDQKAQSLNIT